MKLAHAWHGKKQRSEAKRSKAFNYEHHSSSDFEAGYY
jgi:hypothetical protein